jgi:hypothetical protein
MSVAALVFALAPGISCTGAAESGPQQPASDAGDHALGGPRRDRAGSDTPAMRACKQLAACRVQPYAQCLPQANAVDDEELWSCVAASTCEQLAGGAKNCTGGEDATTPKK